MKRKVKKFRSGDRVEGDYDSSDDARNLIAAAEREKADYEGRGRDVYDETGTKSRLKRNLETGELYDPTGEVSTTKTVTRRAAPATGDGKKASGSTPAAKSESSKSTSSPTTRQGKRVAEIEKALSKPAGDYKSSGNYGEAARSSRTLGDLFRGSARHPRTGATYKKGGSVGSASKRADGIAQRGKTRGRIV